MELTNEFEVPVSLDEAWKVLTDVERIAPCLPGAELKEIEGEEYRGLVRVKVGPITASYKGAARFEELDEVSHRAVLKAEGRETRGQGNATALVTATLSELSPARTKVSVATELNITGKVAQFSRGVLGDVSTKLLEQFAHNLEANVLTASVGDEGAGDESPGAETGGAEAPSPAPARKRPVAKKEPAAEASEAAPPENEPSEAPLASEPAKEEGDGGAIRQVVGPAAEPIDLVGTAGGSLAKRLVPYASVAGGIFLLRIVVYALRRRKK